MAVLLITKSDKHKALRLGTLVQSCIPLATQGRLLHHAAGPLPNENSATEPSEPGNNAGGPKDPPSDQSTYQDPNDEEDIQDEGNPDEPDDDEDCSEMPRCKSDPECDHAELGAIGCSCPAVRT